MNKTRLNVYIQREHGKRLDELATMKNLSRFQCCGRGACRLLVPGRR